MGVHDTQLVIAIEQHHTEDAVRLIGKISDVNYQTIQRRTALHTAVKCNNVAVAAMLLKRGASMNILPKNRAHHNIYQSPMLLALEMGESHEEMQLLFLHHLKVVRHRWESDNDETILKNISKYAMQHSSPSVFYEATRDSSVENLRDAEGMTHLMHTTRRVTLFCSEPAKCTRTMQNVIEIVNTYPALAWERLECLQDSCPGTEAKSCTALGMLVFDNLEARQLQNLKFAELADKLVMLRNTLLPNDTTLLNYTDMVQTDKQKNASIMAYLTMEFIPNFFTMMLRPMRIALAMATHIRLGPKEHCWATGLHTDMIDMIFNVLIRDIVESPCSLKAMLC